jgi:hypothetical protein
MNQTNDLFYYTRNIHAQLIADKIEITNKMQNTEQKLDKIHDAVFKEEKNITEENIQTNETIELSDIYKNKLENIVNNIH